MFPSGVAYPARRRREVTDDLQVTPELGDSGPLQFGVNMMVQYWPVSRDGDPEEPGRVLDRESMVSFRLSYKGCIVSASKGCLNKIL